MTLTLTPHKLAGSVTPPPSKSQSHRFLIAAALAGEGSVIHNLADSQDIQATRQCMAALLDAEKAWWPLFEIPKDTPPEELKARQVRQERALQSTGGDLPLLFCGESGSTLRFLIPVALALRGGARFWGEGRLMERPQKPYFDLFEEKGVYYRQRENILGVRGVLAPGEYRLPGDVSSQFITGLLYALPLLEDDSKIILTTDLESRNYVDMTLEALTAFGVKVFWLDDRTLAVSGGQTYRPAEVTIEADWSQAGFWYAANGLGNEVDIKDMNPHSTQGDRRAADYFEQLCRPGTVNLDVSQCPDLVPELAVHAALRAGQTTHIVNAARLRMKESDRLAAVREELCKLGGRVSEGPDSLTIQGVDAFTGGRVDSHNDHRIAMMLAVAATRCVAPVSLAGAESVRKSYPNFWEDYTALGGRTTREEDV